MAQAKKGSFELNLLPGDSLEDRPGGYFLRWALTWGKRIVVGTELVVILAFLSRFWLDTTVADLSEKIEAKRAVIASSSEFEKKFRSVMSRVDQASTIENTTSPVYIYRQAKKLIPPQLSITAVTVSERSVSFSATTDEQSLAKLVDSFRSSQQFADITIDRVAKSGTTSAVDFSFQASFVKTP